MDPKEKQSHPPELLLTVEQGGLIRLRHLLSPHIFSNSSTAPTWYSQFPSTRPLSAAKRIGEKKQEIKKKGRKGKGKKRAHAKAGRHGKEQGAEKGVRRGS